MNNKNKLSREAIAMRVSKELHNGNVVNLGIGIPTLCPQFIDPDKFIMYHSESGVLNYGEMASERREDINLINAGGQYLSWDNPGMSVFDSAESFAMIRGGHIDVAVLGAYQISTQGNLANWKLTNRKSGNIGGAMDLAIGAKKLIIAMEHIDKKGNIKLVNKCSLPITGSKCVNTIVTDIAVIEIINECMVLKEILPGWGIQDVQEITEPKLIIDKNLKEIQL